jgi:hypothetical protein
MNHSHLNSLLLKFKERKDALDEAEAVAKAIRAEASELEDQILEVLNTLDLDSVAIDGISAKRVTKWRAKYVPDQWSAIVSWAVANGYDYLVQRRLNDTKVLELVDGGIQLPEGLSMETYTDLSFRRS